MENCPLTDSELQDYFLVVAQRKALDKKVQALTKIEDAYKKKFTGEPFESKR
jgi:hypothetical protein